eukprot:349801-Chlamydomonas_euryale.AAC.61
MAVASRCAYFRRIRSAARTWSCRWRARPGARRCRARSVGTWQSDPSIRACRPCFEVHAACRTAAAAISSPMAAAPHSQRACRQLTRARHSATQRAAMAAATVVTSGDAGAPLHDELYGGVFALASRMLLDGRPLHDAVSMMGASHPRPSCAGPPTHSLGSSLNEKSDGFAGTITSPLASTYVKSCSPPSPPGSCECWPCARCLDVVLTLSGPVLECKQAASRLSRHLAHASCGCCPALAAVPTRKAAAPTQETAVRRWRRRRCRARFQQGAGAFP